MSVRLDGPQEVEFWAPVTEFVKLVDEKLWDGFLGKPQGEDIYKHPRKKQIKYKRVSNDIAENEVSHLLADLATLLEEKSDEKRTEVLGLVQQLRNILNI